MAKISLCMIVKNEEKVLRRCLDAAKRFADEIIVVDTGSDDSTREIARAYTDKVYDFEWNYDFSAARNYSFSKAESEYVMWLDADDVVRDEETVKINAWKKNPDADTLYCFYDASFDSNGNPTFTFMRERIMKNDGRAVWKGFIHECVTPFGKVVKSDIRIEHRPRPDKPKKIDRNLEIYRKNIQKGARLNARDKFYYGKELLTNGYTEEGILMIESMVNVHGAFYVNKIEGLRLIGDAKHRLGDSTGAKKAYVMSFVYGAPRAGALNGLGRLAKEAEDYAEAALWFNAALNCADHSREGDFERAEERGLFPYIELSCCLWRLGRREEAFEMHKKAAALAPDHPSVKYNEKFFSEYFGNLKK